MIEIKNLTFRYAGSNTDALKNLSINIPEGKYIAILGHNGSGKSTLSKVLVGLYKPTGGSVVLDNIKINKSNLTRIRKKIGIVFQNPDNQFVGSTVEDDIAFGLENKRVPREKMKGIIDKYSEMVGMNSFLTHEPQNLSGGQKQRVAIASTLALDPKIIIFDEVTSMLDPKGKREVISIIKQIQRKKEKTLISITHDMDEAILADEVIVMAGGRVIASGSPREILNNKKITDKAKIEPPFIYKVSEAVKKRGFKPTFDEKELIGELCK